MTDSPQAAPGGTVPPKPATKTSVWIGFGLGLVPWLLACIPQKDYGAITFLIFACFGLPIIAVIVAIIPKTRRLGLGLLLASGLGWLVLGAMCSGFFR